RARSKTTVWAVGLACLTFLVVGLVLFTGLKDEGQSVAKLTPAADQYQSIYTPAVQAVVESEPVASASPSVQALANIGPVSPLPSPSLDPRVESVLKLFYLAYSKGNRADLEQLMASDISPADQATRASLFQAGAKSGLFVSDNALERAVGYTVLEAKAEGVSWQLNLQEQRVNGSGQPLPALLTQMQLIQSGEQYLVVSYHRHDGVEKYSAFITP
ncbi:MAG: hypothetical protein WCG94_08915, partial [Methanothrix sp.]